MENLVGVWGAEFQGPSSTPSASEIPDFMIPKWLASDRHTWVTSGLLSPGLQALYLEILHQERHTEARPSRDKDFVRNGEEGGRQRCCIPA